MSNEYLTAAEVAELIKNDVNTYTSAGGGADFSEPLPDGDYVCSLFDLKVQNPDFEGTEDHIIGKMSFQVVQDIKGDRTWKGKVVTKNHKIYNPEVEPKNMLIATQIFLKKINMLDPEYWQAVANKKGTEWLNTAGAKFNGYDDLRDVVCPDFLNAYSTFKNENNVVEWGELYTVQFFKNKAGYSDFKILGLAEMPDDL